MALALRRVLAENTRRRKGYIEPFIGGGAFVLFFHISAPKRDRPNSLTGVGTGRTWCSRAAAAGLIRPRPWLGHPDGERR